MPDMALYHSDDSHYDLLVEDDSRLAHLGLIAGSSPDNRKESLEINAWKKVERKKSSKTKKAEQKQFGETLLEESEMEETSKNIDEEITLLGFKTGGYKRAGPQEESKPNTNRVFKCTSCTKTKCN